MLLDVLTAEQAAVAAGTAEPCSQSCDDGCHGTVTCSRAVHAHDPEAPAGSDVDGRPLPAGDVVPHLGLDVDGQLMQWTCLPGDHDGLTCEERTAKREADAAAAKAEATRALYASIDPALLVTLLREGGHV
jgi:hypothetical protein